MRSILLATTALMLLSGCDPKPTSKVPDTATAETATASDASAIAAETARLNEWFDTKFEEELQRSPLTLTYLGRKDKYDQVDDASWTSSEADLQWRRDTVKELKADFSYDLLTDEAKMSYDLWTYILESAENNWKWRHYGYIFEQMGGAQATPPQFMIAFHSVDTEADMIAYISRIDGFATQISTLLDHAKEAAAMGIRAPVFAYEGALDQAQKVVSGAPFDDGEDSALFSDAKGKIDALVEAETITAERGDELKASVSAALTGPFKASYDALAEWLETDVANTDAEHGVSALPDGLAYYNHMLANSTTTALTADEVHEIGLSEVARLREQMIAVKDKFGYEGTLQEFFVWLRETKDDERLYFPNTDEGRQGYIDAATKDIANIKTQLPAYFGLLPKADVVVKRVEPFREQDGAAQHYNSGTPDGSRPGVYYAHLSDMKAMPKRELEVIAYHEAIPGHHMQISIAQELTGIPQFRTQQFYNAYVEGWALYAEHLAKEMPGTYQDDLSEFGRLGSEIWRAIRLVVDTGLHTKGWTKQQAIEYFQTNSAITDGQALAEVERYITWPGQATGYKIGMIKILELRARAEETLGDKFDIRGFHDAVLGGGGLPLPVLEKRVDQWIASIQAS